MRTLKTLLAVGLAGLSLAYPLAGAARVDIDVEIARRAAPGAHLELPRRFRVARRARSRGQIGNGDDDRRLVTKAFRIALPTWVQGSGTRARQHQARRGQTCP